MPPARHNDADESAFMADLLAGIDGSFFDAVPSPDRPSRTRKNIASPLHSRLLSAKSSPLRNKCLLKTPTKTRAPTNQEHVASPSERAKIVSLLEGAENWDWDDMNDDFMTPKKSSTSTSNTYGSSASSACSSVSQDLFSDVSRTTSMTSVDVQEDPVSSVAVCTRCTIEKVRIVRTKNGDHKELIVSVHTSLEQRQVILQDDWFHLDVRCGDVVNIIGSFVPLRSENDLMSKDPSSSSKLPSVTLTSRSSDTLLIHHPDILITATALASTPTCLRKPVLSSLIHSSSDVTPALVWGNMLHEIMQSSLVDWTAGLRPWDQKEMDRKIDREVKRGLGDLLKLGVSVNQAKRELQLRASGLKPFHDKYIGSIPKDEAVLTNTRSERGKSSLLAINKLHDIEEDIWSYKYGLKGKLDVSVQAIITDTVTPGSSQDLGGSRLSSNRNAPLQPSATLKVAQHSHPAPLELKTGRSSQVMEHRAQTLLYTVLMEERYGTPVPSGLLYYTQSDEVVRVPRSPNELRALILKRNEMAGYLARRMGLQEKKDHKDKEERASDIEDFLPPTIDDMRTCGKCYVVDTCMLYRRAVESVNDTSSPIADIYDLKSAHLTPAQREFFKKWENLISLEERDLVRFKKELWTMTAREREAHGRCFADMILDELYQENTSTPKTAMKREGRIHQFTYRFTRAAIPTVSQEGALSLLNGHMSAGDAITISVEPDLLAFVRGYILSLTPDGVIVGVDHELNISAIVQRRPKLADAGPVIFRIDKDELFGGMGRIRGNLAQLFYADGDKRRLELVVDLQAPRFTETPTPSTIASSGSTSSSMILNANQQAAIQKVLCTLDYSLILGMPGTGKTTVIAALIQTLVSMGKTVLLTSYTHSAVDAILLKLKDSADFGILRLGNLDKVHRDVHKFTLSASSPPTTIEQLEHQVMSPPVVATTCLSIDHPLFSRRTFDYCIVDEASQVTLPTCLGPLRYADKFVLVGDHFQLPPLVRNRDAKRGGLEISLFRRLSEAHPKAVIDLHEQYRMNEDIMVLSNKLIYSDRLRCGSEGVAKRGLVLPRPNMLKTLHPPSGPSSCPGNTCWIEKLLDESCKAVFVNTDNVPALDSRVGDLTQNVTEAILVQQVTKCLVDCGVLDEEIGVISLYRQQIKLLSHLLQEHKGVEILTADRSQGRDKDCIIISMVRSNDAGQIGDLLKDWRRMNVAFTRARSKLIIFGSRKTLQTTSLLEEFFQLMDSRGWILTLPPDAHKLHPHLTTSDDTPRKRSCAGSDGDRSPTESCDDRSISPRSFKKARKSAVADTEALLKGRPILKDLLNDNA